MMSQNKKISIAFYWHMHQPIYQLSPEGDYLMPWVRLHAIKDYLDMLLILDEFKNIKLNFNLTPVLLDALVDYGENNMHDLHSRLTVTPISKLNSEDKEFILNNFFDSNYKTMIYKSEEYDRLYQKRYKNDDADIMEYTEQEYSDLMALFNLAWFDPVHIKRYPELKKLIKKEKNYTLDDRCQIIEIQRKIIREIIPAYKKFIEAGKIEVTTSPYYHPILPILLDINDANITDKDSLPKDLGMEEDAKTQTISALDRVEQLLGKRPRGIWPSEQCISPKELDLFKSVGVDWTIADDGILSDSIGFEFVRDFKGYLEEPYHLLKTYNYKNDLKMIFRNSLASKLIGFEYPNIDPVLSANDLYDRIKVMQSKLLTSPDENHLLTIAMDGENSWENYPQDGYIFLKTLYKLIEDDDSLETVLISDYVDKDKSAKPINKIALGSWINRNFKLWIDEPTKNIAWNYLKKVRDDFVKFEEENPNHQNLEFARRELFICEGSDWFWWYGAPNDSGRDYVFDYLFREHLKNIYTYLGLETPEYLDLPLLSESTRPTRYPKGEIKPLMDGGVDGSNDDSWLNAGCIGIPDGPVMRENKFFDKICFGYDEDNFYLRFYINEYVRNNPDMLKQLFQIYVYTRCSEHKHNLSPIRLINKNETVLPVSKEKFHTELQLAVVEGEIRMLRLIKSIPHNLWAIQNPKEIVSVYDKVIDLKIPFSNLDIEQGENMEFIFIIANAGMSDLFIPNEMLLSITRY